MQVDISRIGSNNACAKPDHIIMTVYPMRAKGSGVRGVSYIKTLDGTIAC